MDTRDFGFWFCGVLTGVTLGAAAGVLFAPQSGLRTRRKLRRKAEEAQDHLEEVAEDIADKGRELLDRKKKLVTDTALQAAASAVRAR